MKTYRNGKIARLPKTLREELNTRLDNNESGTKLLVWLNTHPDVQRILAEQFAGRPISQQNLSEWRRGGYQEWLELQEKRHATLKIFENTETQAAGLNPEKITAAFASIAAATFVQSAQTKLKAATDPEKHWEAISEIQDKLIRLRLADYRAGHLKLRQERDARQAEDRQRTLDEVADAEERRQMIAYFDLKPTVESFAQQAGANLKAFDLATFRLELKHNLPSGWLTQKPEGKVTRAPNITPDSSNAPDPSKCIPNNPQSKIRDPQLASTPTNPIIHPSNNPTADDPIPLANSCTPEEFATRSNTRHSPLNPNSSHVTCPSSLRPAKPRTTK